MRPTVYVVALLTASCGWLSSAPPEADDEPNSVAAADGEVVLELVVTPEEVAADEVITVELHSDGDSGVEVGREQYVERWHDGSWQRLAWPEGFGWTDDLTGPLR